MSQAGIAYFSHGLESGPKARKVVALANIATELGWRTVIPDYRGQNLEQRISLLTSMMDASNSPTILLGSSMGAAVSIRASLREPVAGLFLLAPAVFLPGYDEVGQTVAANRISVVHGWDDDVVPPDNAIRFARTHSAELHLFDDDHRLTNTLPAIGRLFGDWLGQWATT